MYYREKFVTNSSSVHEMVWVKKAKALNGAPWGDGEFGSQPFILFRPPDKEKYMAVLLYENFLYHMPHLRGDKDAVVRRVNVVMGHRKLLWEDDSVYINHNSLIVLPRTPNAPPEINLSFFRDFTDYVVNNPHLIVFGGNDNGIYPIIPKGGVIDEIWQQMKAFQVGLVAEVYAYHLDKPRKWKITARQPWNKEEEISKIIEFPEL